ncbi:MAG TPA: NAD-dependent formate dehydrogenase [Rhodopila sp.]|nr:NAD-dependent formate dehydrogenase [Rhodopila sp.]
MARVVCVMYADPAEGHPAAYVRDAIPHVELYPDGQTTPSPKGIDFRPGELLGDVSGALGLRDFLAARGHTLIITADKDGPDSVFERELAEAEIVISQPSWPAQLDAERLAKAPKLKLVVVAGVGSDHVDLAAAAQRGITVAEITYSASVSAAEYAVMLILSLVHNAVPWLMPHGARSRTIGDYARRAYDLEGMRVGSIGAGRSGFALLRRLRPFDVRLHYTDPRRLPVAVESEFGLTYHPDAASMVEACDVVSIHCPLHDGTARLFDAAMIARMRRGSYLVNTGPRGICDPDAIAQALESGHLAGYAADTSAPSIQSEVPAHVAGSTLSAQARYAAGTREVLECWFDGKPIRDDYLLVDRGTLTGVGGRTFGLRPRSRA